MLYINSHIIMSIKDENNTAMKNDEIIKELLGHVGF